MNDISHCTIQRMVYKIQFTCINNTDFHPLSSQTISERNDDIQYMKVNNGSLSTYVPQLFLDSNNSGHIVCSRQCSRVATMLYFHRWLGDQALKVA